MEEQKEGRIDPPKVMLKRFIILAVFLFLYVGVLRVRTISYIDDVIWIYSFSSITDLRPSHGSGIVLSPIILHSKYGDIKLKLFCKVGFNNYRLNHISMLSFSNGRAEHNLEVLGNEIPHKDIGIRLHEIYSPEEDPFAGVGFDTSYDGGGYHVVNGDMSLGEYIFAMRQFTIEKDNDSDLYILEAVTGPESIILSDKTQIDLTNSWRLTIEVSQNQWILTAGARKYFTIISSNKKEQKCSYIIFEQYWGKIIEIGPYNEPEEKASSEPDFEAFAEEILNTAKESENR